jgi:hypothetical protein
MKKLLAISFFALFSTAAIAGSHHNHHRGGDRWVAPLVGGIILGAMISKQNEVVVDERPIYIAPPPPIVHVPVGPQFYNCLVRVYDQYTGIYRNEVMTCVR